MNDVPKCAMHMTRFEVLPRKEETVAARTCKGTIQKPVHSGRCWSEGLPSHEGDLEDKRLV